MINVRFFMCVVQNGDPTPILQKIKRMLKPGGWVQWTEMDLETLAMETTASKKEELAATQDLFRMAKAPSPKWPARLLTLVLSSSQPHKVI